MGMRIDKTGRNDHVGSVDRLLAALSDFADFGDTITGHGNVAAEARRAGSIDDGAVLDYEIIRHRESPSWLDNQSCPAGSWRRIRPQLRPPVSSNRFCTASPHCRK